MKQFIQLDKPLQFSRGNFDENFVKGHKIECTSHNDVDSNVKCLNPSFNIEKFNAFMLYDVNG